MKKFFASLLLCMLTGLAFTSCSDNDDYWDDYNVSFYDLPSKAISFVYDFFPDEKVVKVDYDVDHKESKYEVEFKSGLEVEFDSDGHWISIEAPEWGYVPDAVVPDFILSYVDDRFPRARITDISRESWGYEVELSNDVDLRFDYDGYLLDVDR